MKYDVFISYRRDCGSDLASYFESILANNNFSAYLDIEDVYTGEFMVNIENAISRSDLFLMIITEGSLERFKNTEDVARKELEYAIKSNINILPISLIGESVFNLINNEKDLPECLKLISTHNTKFYDHKNKKALIDYILQLVKQIRKNKFNITMTYNLTNDFFKSVKQIKLKEKYIYSGGFKLNAPYKEGTLIDPNSNFRYDLNWRGKTLTGVGTVYNGANELIYEGEIEDLQYHGSGKLYTNEGVYEGNFKYGKRNGKGKFKFINGCVYEGWWYNDYIDGYGYMKNSNGEEYEGYFITTEDGVFEHGLGTKLCLDGSIKDGEWRNGIFRAGLHKRGDFIFLGDFENDLLEGNGKVYSSQYNRLLYSGKFKKNLFNGSGLIYPAKEKKLNLIPVISYEDDFLNKTISIPLQDHLISIEGTFTNNRLCLDEDLIIRNENAEILYKGKFFKKDQYKFLGTIITQEGEFSINYSCDDFFTGGYDGYEILYKFKGHKVLNTLQVEDKIRLRGIYVDGYYEMEGFIFIDKNTCDTNPKGYILKNKEFRLVTIKNLFYNENNLSYIKNKFSALWNNESLDVHKHIDNDFENIF